MVSMVSSLLAALVACAYMACAVKAGGIPDCLSATYYTLKRGWLFTTLMVVESALCFPAMWEGTAPCWRWLVVVAALTLCGVGFTPYKHCDKHYKAHYVMACIAMASVVVLYMTRGQWYMPMAFLVVGLRKNWLLGVETALLASCWVY